MSGVFEAWVTDCPLAYHSNHASDKRAVLATLLLSILAGHHRYAPITAIRYAGIHPALLGVAQLVSEDAARRALARIDDSSGVAARRRHANAPCRTNAPDHHPPARQAVGHPSRADQLGGLPECTERHCGAVDRCRTPASDSYPRVRQIHAHNSSPSGLANLRNCSNLTR